MLEESRGSQPRADDARGKDLVVETGRADGAHGNPLEVFLAFLRLGLTSFGGPIAHLGYFQRDIVQGRKWISEKAYGDLVALCQFLPGPTSSQVCYSLGMMRSGILGAIGAWFVLRCRRVSS